jgi:hypothetical protein
MHWRQTDFTVSFLRHPAATITGILQHPFHKIQQAGRFTNWVNGCTTHTNKRDRRFQYYVTRSLVTRAQLYNSA